MNNNAVSFFAEKITKSSEIHIPISGNNSNQSENMSFEKILTNNIERENKLKNENHKNKIKEENENTQNEEKNSINNNGQKKLENNNNAKSDLNENSLQSNKVNINALIKNFKIENAVENNNREKNGFKTLEKNINEILNFLNLIFNKIDKSINNENSLNNPSIDTNSMNKFKASIKDIYDKLKNVVSQEGLKKALKDIEKLMDNPSFKTLIEQIKKEGQTQSTGILKLLLELPSIAEKLKNSLSTLEAGLKNLTTQIVKDIKTGETETGHKDFRLIQGRHRIVENDSRHRSNNEDGNNLFNQNNKNKNFENFSRNQINTNNNTVNSVINFENTLKNVSINETIENKNFNTLFTTRDQIPLNKEIFNQLTRSVRYAVDGNKKEMTMHIEPKELGRVNIKLTMENGNITAKFAVENDKVHSLLTENRSELIKQLENAGMKVDNVDIELQSGNQSSGKSKNPFENNEIDEINFFRTSKKVNSNYVDDNNDQIINYYTDNPLLPEWLASEVNITI